MGITKRLVIHTQMGVAIYRNVDSVPMETSIQMTSLKPAALKIWTRHKKLLWSFPQKIHLIFTSFAYNPIRDIIFAVSNDQSNELR